jgi:hypothetical protein
MTISSRVFGGARSRSERVRARRARDSRRIEPPAPRRPTRSTKGRRPRRRFDLALPAMAGAEMRLPALPVVRTGPRLVSLLGLLLAGWATTAMLRSPAFIAGEALVEGQHVLSAGQIRSMAGVEQASILALDPSAVEAQLQAHPEVAAAQVSVGWPNRVRIVVKERHPMIEWVDAGRRWWISSDGVAYLGKGDWPGLPRVESEEPVLRITEDPLEKVIPTGILQAAAVLSAQLPEVETWSYDRVHGLSYMDRRGWQVYFGQDGDMVTKYRLYQAIAEYLSTQHLAASVVSVEEVSAPYYRVTR